MNQPQERADDIPRMRAALDNERMHQRFRGKWRRVHEFAVDTLTVIKNGVRVRTIKIREL